MLTDSSGHLHRRRVYESPHPQPQPLYSSRTLLIAGWRCPRNSGARTWCRCRKLQLPKCGGDLRQNVGNSGCGGPSSLNKRGWNVNGSGCWGGGGRASASISLMLGIPSSSSSRSTLSRRPCCIPVAKKMRQNKVHSPCFMELKAVVSINFFFLYTLVKGVPKKFR